MRPLPALTLLVIGMMLSGCGGGGGGGGGGSTPAPVLTKTWTILIYGSADNSLNYSLAADMSEMGQATLGSHMNVIVVADWDASQLGGGGGSFAFEPTTTGAAYPTGTQRFRIRGGNLAPTLLTQTAEEDFDTPTVLQTATQNIFQQFPAERLGVILWDHGGSWQGGFGGDEQNHTRNGTGMPAAAAATAIGNGLSAAGITGARPLELVAFDTCLMACPEVIHPFKDLAKTYLACAEIDFGNGWDYTATLTNISANSTALATTLAAQEVTEWNAHHTTAAGATSSDQLVRSHAAFDLSKWDAFATAVGQAVTAIRTSPTMTVIDWGTRQFPSVPGYRFADSSSLEQPRLRDVGQLFGKLGTVTTDTTVATKATAVVTALTSMRLGLSQGTFRSVNGQTGLHIECALSKTYTTESTRIAEYQTNAAAWDGVTAWSSLLGLVQTFDDNTQPVISQSVTTTGAGATVDFTANDVDIGEVSITALRDIGGGTFQDFGLIAADYIDPGSFSFDWDFTVATASNGTTSSFARVERVVVGDSEAIFGFLGTYTIGPDTRTGFLIFGSSDTASGTFLEITADDSLSVLPLFPGASFTPFLLQINGSTITPVAQTAITIPSNQQVIIGTQKLPGTYRLALNGTDVWGNNAVSLTTPIAVAAR